MISLSASRRGKCLSEKYVNAHTKLEFECSEGHRWSATPYSVKTRNSWCPECARKRNAESQRFSLDDLQSYAKSKGGLCLAKAYKDRAEKVEWQCAEGHQWWASTHSVVMARNWCPRCSSIRNAKVKRAVGRYDDLQEIARSRGGRCVSNEYLSMHHYIRWECLEGHQWDAKPSDIMHGNWCPRCSSGVGEEICRAFFEQLFDQKFPRKSPHWLLNSNGNRMELDGYCSDLKLAFEHHGEQHYTTKGFYIKSQDKLKERQQADAEKCAICERRGVILIEIPEVPTRTKIDELRDYIGLKCSEKKVRLPEDFFTKKVDLVRAYSQNKLKELSIIAHSMGGKLISKIFLGLHHKYIWECERGHRWTASAASIKHQGTWCPECKGKPTYTIEDMHKIAKTFGGRCASIQYKGAHQKLTWECSQGHLWEAIPTNVISGHWCPKCAGCHRGNLEEMKEIAANRGGKCLSGKYINSATKLKWECADGHVWEALPSNVKNKGSWCPICSKKKLGRKTNKNFKY
jgi:hypothetical protein